MSKIKVVIPSWFTFMFKSDTHATQRNFICWVCSMIISIPTFNWGKKSSNHLPSYMTTKTRSQLSFFIYFSIRERICIFISVQSLSRVQLFATPWIAAHQASLSITNSRSSLKLTSIKSVMPSSHLILCRPLFLLPPIPPSIRVFSSESTLCMRWPKYWSFSLSISPSNEVMSSSLWPYGLQHSWFPYPSKMG